MLKVPEKFDEYPDALKSEFLRFGKFKEDGGKLVGTVCTYAPIELIMAAGATPICITTVGHDTVPAAEKHLPKNMCPMVTSTYGSALTDLNPAFYYTEMVLSETSCDGRKKMYEKLNELKPVHSMHLPQGIHAPGALDYWYSEVLRAKEALEKTLGTEITDEKLRTAIKLTNRERKAAQEFFELGKLNPCPIKAEELLSLAVIPITELDIEKRIQYIEDRTAELKAMFENGEVEKSDRPRVLVTGCPLMGVSEKVLTTLREAGVDVVALENCCGLREKKDLIDEEKEPLMAIAEKYLKIACAVMTPNPDRFTTMAEYIDEFKIDGVVEVVLQTCHPFAIEADSIETLVSDEKGIPYLYMETDFSPTDKGQISTRIGAFVELLIANKQF